MGTFLVTGGAGFIGSNIVLELVRQKAKVKVLDNFSTGKLENLGPVLNDVRLIYGDVRDRHIVEEAMRGVEYVLHQAALPSVQRSIKDPMASNDVNIAGTLNLLLAAKKYGIKRFVFASSSSIYGNSARLPKKETMPPNPLSPYAVTKLADEKFCQCFYQIYGLETVCLRYFNVFGPRQNPDSQYAAVIPNFIKALLLEQQPIVYGDGEQSRDFTYIENAVQANILACHAPHTAGEVINIACGERYSLNQLLQTLEQILDCHSTPRYVEPRPGDVRHSQADISKAQKLLSYKPLINFEEGLKKTTMWYKQELLKYQFKIAKAG